MISRILVICLILSLLPFILSGCWSRQELNDMGIVLMMSLDKAGDKYEVTVQFVNPAEIASQRASSRAAVTSYHAEGNTVLEAVRKISTTAPKKLFFAHMRMLIMGEKLAREGIAPALDYLYRYHEIRSNFYLVIAKDNPGSQILKILTPVEQIPATGLFSQLENASKLWGATGRVKMDEVIMDLVNAGREPTLPGIILIGDRVKGNTRQNVESASPFAVFKYTQMAVFHQDKLIGWLNDNESKGFNFTQSGKIKTSVELLQPCQNKKGKAVVDVMHAEPKIQVTMKHNMPHIRIRIKANGNVSEVTCKAVDLSQEQTIKKLEKQTEQSIKRKIADAVDIAQHKYKDDIFGFGQSLHRHDAKAWQAIENEWEQDLFPAAEVRIIVNFKIRNVGTKGNSFIKEMK